MRSLPDLGRRIVGVFAHPDDFIVGAAGTMYRYSLQGAHIISVSATRGEAGAVDPATWPADQLGAIRTAEEQLSARIAGIQNVRFLDFADGYLDKVPFEIGVAAVLQIFKETAPTAVFTYGPDGLTGHPDHRVISAWVTAAFQRAALPGARLFYVVANNDWHAIKPVLQEAGAMYGTAPDIVATPGLTLDHWLSLGIFARKLRSILAHRSQYVPLGRRLGGLHRLHHWFRRESFQEA